MNKIADFFYRRTNLIIAIILTVATFSYLFLVMLEMAKCFAVPDGGPESLGTTFGFDSEVVLQFFSARSGEMLDCYREFNTIWDSIFALLYGLMYVGWLSLIFNPYKEKIRFLNLLPLLQTVFDWLENYTLAGLAESYQLNEVVSLSAIKFASFSSMAKWTCSTIVFSMIVVGIVLRILAVIRKNQKNNA